MAVRRVTGSPFGELGEDLLGGSLAGALFGKALRLADPFFSQPHFDREGFRMLRTILGDDDVARRRKFQGLRHFLQGAFVIGNFAVVPSSVVRSAPDHAGFDELARGFEAGVDVQRGDQGFDGVGKQGLFLTPAAHFLTAPEYQKFTQAELHRDFMQARGADQVGLQLGEAAFGKRCEAAHQALTDHEAEDRVSQEFELLVVGGECAVGPLFIDPRFMGERPFEQFTDPGTCVPARLRGSRVRRS